MLVAAVAEGVPAAAVVLLAAAASGNAAGDRPLQVSAVEALKHPVVVDTGKVQVMSLCLAAAVAVVVSVVVVVPQSQGPRRTAGDFLRLMNHLAAVDGSHHFHLAVDLQPTVQPVLVAGQCHLYTGHIVRQYLEQYST